MGAVRELVATFYRRLCGGNKRDFPSFQMSFVLRTSVCKMSLLLAISSTYWFMLKVENFVENKTPAKF